LEKEKRRRTQCQLVGGPERLVETPPGALLLTEEREMLGHVLIGRRPAEGPAEKTAQEPGGVGVRLP
jgi:hypothetical protein